MNVDEGTTSSETSEVTTETNTTEVKTEETPEAKTLVEGEKTEAVVEEFVPLTAADITIPEGLEVNDELVSEALTIINNRELSAKDQLQGLVNLQAKLAKDASETISKTWEDTQKAWQDEVKADPTIGGDKLQTSLAAVNKLVTEYGSAGLVEAFELTGAGNNPHIIRFLHNVAGKLLEGGIVSATNPSSQGEDAASRLFPSMKKG